MVLNAWLTGSYAADLAFCPLLLHGHNFWIHGDDGVVMPLMTKDDEDCSGDAQAYSSHACGGIATSIVLDNA